MSLNSKAKGKRGVWKDIPQYEGLYQANENGEIRSLPRIVNNIVCKGKILKQYINKKNGYCYVGLSKNGKQMTKRVHCLIMQTFLPVNKKDGYDKNFTINHIDGDKTNNNLSNLEWCTQSENQIQAYKMGINPITWNKKVICLDNHKIFTSLKEAVTYVGGKNVSMITRVCQGLRSHYRNYHFAYYDDFLNGTIPQFMGKSKRSSVSLWR